MPARKKLIEVSIPLEAINAESSRRKQKAPKGYPTAIHKYWAQRPVAACRAVLFAQLVDDPSSWPDRFQTEEQQDEERRRLHRVMEKMLLWEASNDDATMTAARWEIARSLAWNLGEEPPPQNDPPEILAYIQGNAPPLFDPFSGAGSIPLEAQRLGLKTFGSDLNPVAVLIGKALVEIPARFAAQPPVNPEAQAAAVNGQLRPWKGAQGLAEDVRYYGAWLRNELEIRIGEFFPKITLQDNSEGTVVAWLWARTVKSPDPKAKGAMVPLVSTFIVSNKEGRKVWVEPTLSALSRDGYHFEVRSGALTKTDEVRLRGGTKVGRGSHFTCILTGSAIDADYVKSEGVSGRIGTRLLAIVADGDHGRTYVSPVEVHEATALSASPAWEPTGELPNDPRAFWVVQYGLTRHADLFTSRQLMCLTTCSDLIQEIHGRAFKDAQDAGHLGDPTPLHDGGRGVVAYADAIATYIALVVDRMVFYGSSLCGWLAKDNAMGKSMPQQGLAMTWDFAEGNPLGKSSSSVLACAKAVADCVAELRQAHSGSITQGDARHVTYPDPCIICTDPPYYDNFPYADSADFFYAWLIPTALGIDRCPLTGADRTDAVWIVDQKVPSILASLEDGIVTVPDQGTKFVGSQIGPDILHRVQLGRVGRQGNHDDVVRLFELATALMPAGAVANQRCAGARSNLCADFLQMQVHALGVGGGRDHRGADAARGADRAEQVCAVVTVVPYYRWPRANGSPDISMRALLPDASLVLKPDLDRGSSSCAEQGFLQDGTEVCLKGLLGRRILLRVKRTRLQPGQFEFA
jgi:putative DNA methylase